MMKSLVILFFIILKRQIPFQLLHNLKDLLQLQGVLFCSTIYKEIGLAFYGNFIFAMIG